MQDVDLGEIVQGDTFSRNMEITGQDGEPIDITGWEIWVTVKDTYKDSDSEALIQKHVTQHPGATEGRTHVEFTETDTEGLSGGKVYDVQVKTANGEVYTVIRGTVQFIEGVTQSD